MPSDIPADVAFMAGLWCEAVLYGVHLVVFGVVCSILLSKPYKRARERSTATLLAFTTFMFITSTAHISLALQEFLLGSIYQHDLDPQDFFGQNVFHQRKALYFLLTILGDSLLVWRVCVIWGWKWISALPVLLLLLASTTCGLEAIISSAHASGLASFSHNILKWVFASFVLNIATQIISTMLIATKIYRAASTCSRNRLRYMSIVWVIIESGAIYTTAAIIQLVLFLIQFNSGVMLEMVLAQLSAIAPALIVIRIGMGVAYDGKNEAFQEDVILTTMHDTMLISINSIGQPVNVDRQEHAAEN